MLFTGPYWEKLCPLSRDLGHSFSQYRPPGRLIKYIIIWQDSLEVNPSVLIGSFLVGILPYGHMLCIFCSRKLANSNYEKKTFKYSHLRKKLPKKIDILQSLQ